MPVKNVQALAANAAELTEEAIKRYIRPARADDVAVAAHGDDSSQSIPVIDLEGVRYIWTWTCNRIEWPIKQEILSAIYCTTEILQFFSKEPITYNTYNLQVKNHGIPDTVLENMRNNLEHFFRLRLDEKNRFGRLPGDLQGYGQAFVESEHQTLDWCDRLYLVTQPPHDREMRPCPTTPVSFRESIESYSSELMRVAGSLMAIIARNLGVDLLRDTYVSQALRMTYYPACPMAHDKVLGISPHSDISMLTLVWELNMVGGLQIKRQDAWVPVKPHPKALVVNVGDFLEILTNGKYQSIEHRVTVNPRKERMSISAFHLPKFDMSVGPLSEIVGAELKKYKTLRVDEVAKVVFSIRLDGKKTKDYAMLSV
ncbi:S-norcoclaurine synthase 1-like [Triticum aestivum]|uniref:S-norcoclaurine synthase 1-like n=1 Tax=Triticum aestivum TaxID=4565 RepID=UPI001D0174F0|nr:S-norcoclaurine synthase 1-like [Triticum aestivum]